MIPVAATIAGSDPSGGAGVQADLKTFHQHGCYGCAVITLVTAQNTREVRRVHVLSADLVADQLDTLLEDIQPGAIKTGALGTAAVVQAVAQRLAGSGLPVVVDPVMLSKHGATLAGEDAYRVMARELFPHTLLVTPNRDEAQVLSGRPVRDQAEMREAAKAIADHGPKAVLIKGGHVPGDAVDLLYAGGEFHTFTAPRSDSPHLHGVGCTLSAAIVAGLCKGRDLVTAVGNAKDWLNACIRSSPGVGQGICAVNHFAPVPRPRPQ